MTQQHLYIVLLGGKHEKANIEVHDVIPVIANDVMSKASYLKQKWFGVQKGLHIDSWMQVNGVHYKGQNFKIVIDDEFKLDHNDLKLYLINLGAYIPTEFGEVHKYLVVAGIDKADAKAQGKLAIEKYWYKPHTDAVVDIDDCIELSQVSEHYIRLIKSEFEPNTFVNDYLVI